MRRLSLVVTLGVFAWAAGAQAFVGRSQDFEIGALNRVDWAGGAIGSARIENQARVAQQQDFSERHSRLSGVQTERGSLTQTLTASGPGLSTGRQAARITGSQDLPVESCRYAPGRMQQDLGLKMETRLFKPSGVGTVSGTQTYHGAQEQTRTTWYGSSGQFQSVEIKQSGTITTENDIDPTVRNSVIVNLHQSQGMGPQ